MESVVISEEQKKQRVFVTNYAGHDYTDAERYGEFVWITKGFVSFQSLDRVKFNIAELLIKEESNKEDWLLLSGKPIICVVTALIWFALHQKVKILVWDQKNRNKYRELVLTQKNMSDLIGVLVGDE